MSNYNRYHFANPTVNDVNPVNPVLTSLSIGFKNEEFMWEKIAPIHESDKRVGTFPVYTRDAWFKRQGGAERAANSQYLRVDYGVTTDTFETRDSAESFLTRLKERFPKDEFVIEENE